MHWILILVLNHALDHLEFNSEAACKTALSAAKEANSNLGAVCVMKGLDQDNGND